MELTTEQNCLGIHSRITATKSFRSNKLLGTSHLFPGPWQCLTFVACRVMIWVQTLCWQNDLQSYPLEGLCQPWFGMRPPNPGARTWRACAAFLLHTPTDEAPSTRFDSSGWGGLIYMLSSINSFDSHRSRIRVSRNCRHTKNYKKGKLTWIRQTEKNGCFPLGALNLLYFYAY